MYIERRYLVVNRILLANATVYAEKERIEKGCLLIGNGKIEYVGPFVSVPNVRIVELDHRYCIAPGFIDIHIHGASGADVMDATKEALQTMASVLPQEGTTSFLATTMTASVDHIERAVRNVANYMQFHNQPGEAEVLGIHLEGPFLSPKQAGAQHPRNIIEPNVGLFNQWQKEANGNIRLVTLAPEEHGGLALVSYLKESGVVASIGHADAVYQQVKEAIEAGVTHATHLFNGMRGVHHREPGVVGAVLMHDEVVCELIVDGTHVAPEMVRFAYRNKGKEGLIVITDAMRAKCLGEGEYELGGQRVIVQGQQATLQDGTLAGSILKFKDAVKK